MAWHHIIPKHEYLKRFGNLIGVDAYDNLINLTVEQHSEVHRLLYELNGYEGDRIASVAIKGDIGREELQKQISSFAGKLGGRAKGFQHTKEWKQENSKRMKGKRWALGNRFKRPKLTCPSCGKIGAGGAMSRFHFNNCKGRL